MVHAHIGLDLTLLDWRHEEHLARKKSGDEVLAWLSVCSEVLMI